MKTLSFINQNDVNIESEISQNMFTSFSSSFIKYIGKIVKFIKSGVSAIGTSCMQLLRPVDVYDTVNIRHLHNSCGKMKEPERKIFILYIKGYSIEEISSVSGTKRHNIVMIVHNTLKIMKKENILS